MFKSPEYVIPAIIVWILFTIDFFHFFRKPQLYFPRMAAEKNDILKIKKMFGYLLAFMAWSLITIALMQPREQLSLNKNQIEVNDIFFVVDVSRSMSAVDFKPNRLEAAKVRIEEFIDLMPKDRIGIVLFSEKVFTTLPLTTDLDLIKKSIYSINMGPLGAGTNIGDAVALATARISSSEAKNKIIILMTDGVSNVDSIHPLQASEEAAKYGVKIYTIAIGNEEGALMPTNSSIFGTRYQQIPGGSVDIELLKKMAEMTKAKAYTANNSEALKNVFKEISEFEKTKIDVNSQYVFKENYWKFLVYGVILLLLFEIFRLKFLREVL
jgi:Ca-activated chloride channel family protein